MRNEILLVRICGRVQMLCDGSVPSRIEGCEKIRRAFQKYINEHEWTDLWDIAVKEFAERMKNRLENGPFLDWTYEYITMFSDIEEVEKEMTEEQGNV